MESLSAPASTAFSLVRPASPMRASKDASLHFVISPQISSKLSTLMQHRNRNAKIESFRFGMMRRNHHLAVNTDNTLLHQKAKPRTA